MQRQKKSKHKYKSAKIEIRRPLTKHEAETVRMVALCEFQVRWSATIGAWLCIVLGFLLALLTYDSQTGETTLALGKELSFKGGVGAFLVLAGALILWFNRPKLKLIFKGEENHDIAVAPQE
jgi:hypothetical protein